MANVNFHPLYGAMLGAWDLCMDCYDGEQAIKAKRAIYLPPTAGQVLDGYNIANSIGQQNYDAYLKRAYFPDLYSEAIEEMLGMMYRDEPTINLPPQLESMRLNASNMGETLIMLMKRISFHQLVTGRVGLLGDIVKRDGVDEPVLTVYPGRTVVNWDDVLVEQASNKLRFVVLDESCEELTHQYTWEWKERYRVLSLLNGDKIVDYVDITSRESSVQGQVGVAVMADSYSLAEAVYTPLGLQGTPLDTVPFVFINTKDLSSQPSRPPLIGLANLNLAIYRGEADYRQALHNTGQDTLVKIGNSYGEDGNAPTRIGAGAMIEVPTGGDAKFIGVNSQGLPEQRMALKNDYDRAQNKSSKLFATASSRESGEALKIRMASQTATPAQMLQTVCAGVEGVLKTLAVWFGANPDEVEIIPNTDFSGASSDGQSLLWLAQAKTSGAPISNKSIHEWMVEQGFTELTYDEEMSAIEEEGPSLTPAASPLTGIGAGGQPAGGAGLPNGAGQGAGAGAGTGAADGAPAGGAGAGAGGAA